MLAGQTALGRIGACKGLFCFLAGELTEPPVNRKYLKGDASSRCLRRGLTNKYVPPYRTKTSC